MRSSSRSADSFPDPEVYGETQVREFLDPWHPRASVETDQVEDAVVDPERVLDNVVLAIHRNDVDLDSPSVLEPATITTTELAAMLEDKGRAARLIAHVINTAVQLMVSRYSEPVARAPFPDAADLRHLTSPTVGDSELALARDLFNRRLTSPDDLRPADIVAALHAHDPGGLVRTLAAVSVLYRTKLLVLKHHDEES
jgi:hypothetical protein